MVDLQNDQNDHIESINIMTLRRYVTPRANVSCANAQVRNVDACNYGGDAAPLRRMQNLMSTGELRLVIIDNPFHSPRSILDRLAFERACMPPGSTS